MWTEKGSGVVAELAAFAWVHGGAGWYFSRVKATGDVAIKRVRGGEAQEIHIIPKQNWAAIVASVSRRGDSKPQVQRAVELHG